jgi:hypothetical protein
MAGLLDIFGTGGADTMGLLGMSQADIARNRDDAQAQALYALAGRLFQGGNTGASIAEGLQAGQKAYRGGMQGALQEQLQNAQLQEMIRKRQLEQQALAEQRRIQGILAQGTSPEQVTFQGQPSQFPARDDEGNLMPDMAVRPAGFDLARIAPQLMGSAEGRKTLAELVAAQKAMTGETTKLGKNEQLIRINPITQKPEVIAGGQKPAQIADNPFDIFANDQNVPAALRATAQRYSKSYASGAIDDETADKRFAELSNRIQSSEQFKLAQAQTAALSQGSQATSRMLAEFNIGQKEEKAQEKADIKKQAKQQLSDVVGQLKTSYDTLLEGGGITSTTSGGRENIGAKMGTSAVGQFMGSALGTKNQEQRQVIEQTRPLLLNLIKEATGMSASQMNSNAEMQMYLKAATDPKLSYEANITALQNLDKTFGLGLLKETTPPKKKQQATSSGW